MRTLLFCFLILSVTAARADLLAGWEGVDPASDTVIDHQVWQEFLDKYLKQDDFGQTYFSYARVGINEQAKLQIYIHELETINPLRLNANEQKAYWINLYNAATVAIVLEEYPINSIRDIGSKLGGLIPGGPWKRKIVTVNDQKLSLDNIEHDIVRPKFNDYRVHFAFNCASKGCPNLADTAYSGANIDMLLNEAAVAFVNHQRGVRFQSGRLTLSKIFQWYQADFVDEEGQLTVFLAQLAEPKLRAVLLAYQGGINYEYDWDLNEVRESL
ncbi:MAG: DUF547 domain-containing protein [Reinekea sp.]|jgi:hypothetical protein